MNYNDYKACIDACLQCVAVCNHCAASCLQEDNLPMMTKCVQLDLECAAICIAAAQLMSLGSNKMVFACRLCADICEACANECAKHDTDHCRGMRHCLFVLCKDVPPDVTKIIEEDKKEQE